MGGASATALAPTARGSGMIGPRATRSAIPWITHTHFRRRLGGNSPARAGKGQEARTKR
jgi:hypothetical protein